VVLVFVCLIPAASAREDDTLGLQSFPEFSSRLTGDATGCLWREVAGSYHGVATALAREKGESRWEITYIVHDERGFRTTRLAILDGREQRIGKGIVVRIGGRLMLLFTYYPASDEGTGRVLVYDLTTALATGVQIDAPDASLVVPRFVREADWGVMDGPNGMRLVYADGNSIYSVSIDATADGPAVSEPRVILEREHAIATPAWHVSSGSEAVAVAWREFTPRGNTRIGVGVMSRADPEARIVPVAGERIGFTTPFRGVATRSQGFLGERVTYESRRSLAVHRDGRVVRAATSAVVRERTELSNYHVQPLVLEVTLGESGVVSESTRLVELEESVPGGVDGSFHFTERDEALLLTFLRERPGESVSSSVLSARLIDGAWEVPSVLLDWPRRVVSPHPLEAHGIGLLWFQSDPEAGQWQAGYRDTRASYLSVLEIPWRGSIAETLSSALLGVPLAALLSLYWATLSNALLLGVIVAGSLALFRGFPALVRTRYDVFAVCVILIAAGLAGVPMLSLGGPTPTLVARLLVALPTSALALREGRRLNRLPRPRDLVVWAYRVLVLVVALQAYPYTMRLLS
jgi:hypothetical protein